MSGLFQYNGSAVVAMGGNRCVAIACDRRLGSRQLQTVSANFQKVYPINDKALIGYAGLATDAQTLQNNLRFSLNLFRLREEADIQPSALSSLVGTMLYGRRFSPWFVSPVIVGLDEKNQPFLSAFDFIGAACHAKDFVVAGTSSEQLYGVCEAFWRENMNPEELFETISQCLLAAVDRDCLAGWGAYNAREIDHKVDKLFTFCLPLMRVEEKGTQYMIRSTQRMYCVYENLAIHSVPNLPTFMYMLDVRSGSFAIHRNPT